MIWTAVYSNGDELSQYKDDGSENLFSDIDQTKLEAFYISTPDEYWCVDLTDGTFMINEESFNFEGFDGVDFKLIYFRRVRQVIGMCDDTHTTSVIHHLGWQTNIDGKNYQRVMAIAEDGSITFKIK